MTETWIAPKEGAARAGVSRKTFMLEWIPEVGEPQVEFRNPNGKTGPGRRPEVLLEDLEAVLAARRTRRAS
jgi:hypothetical protein